MEELNRGEKAITTNSIKTEKKDFSMTNTQKQRGEWKRYQTRKQKSFEGDISEPQQQIFKRRKSIRGKELQSKDIISREIERIRRKTFPTSVTRKSEIEPP